jgi:hypothetical protein
MYVQIMLVHKPIILILLIYCAITYNVKTVLNAFMVTVTPLQKFVKISLFVLISLAVVFHVMELPAKIILIVYQTIVIPIQTYVLKQFVQMKQLHFNL